MLQAVFAAGVAVPEPLLACADPAVLGKPFFVMRRIAGSALGPARSRPTRRSNRRCRRSPHGSRRSWRGSRRSARRAPISAFCRGSTRSQHIAAFRAYLDRHPQPAAGARMGDALGSRRICPEPLPPVLCHRDFRTGNYMLDGAELTGILDWEFAGWGDPDEDIGWLCCKGWRFARLDREAGGIADARGVLSRLRSRQRAGVSTPSGSVLGGAGECPLGGHRAAAERPLSDRRRARASSTAIIGRRATECELELLMLLDPDGAAQPDRAAAMRDLPSEPRSAGARARIAARRIAAAVAAGARSATRI